MGRILKIFGIVVGALLALVIIAGVIFTLTFDPNDYKDRIASAVREATGRDLVIEGDLELSLFPWLAIEVGRTELGNADGFGDTPFATFDSARLSVRVMPLLLRREIVVGTAALESLDVNLEARADGRDNWSDLAEAGATEPSAPEEPAEPGMTATFDVGSIEITDASLTYTDAASGSRYIVSDLDLQTGRVRAGESVPIDGGLSFTVEPDGISGRVDIAFGVTFDTEAATVSLRDLAVEGRVEGATEAPATFGLDAPAIVVQTEAQNANFGRIDLRFMSVELRADVEPFSYEGDPQPAAKIGIAAFSPKTLMSELGLEAPPTADPGALTKLIVDADARVGASAITLTNLKLVIDDTTFTGRLSVPRGESGKYELELAGDSIDVARYMAPADEGAAAEAEAAETVEIPVDLIRAFDARGNVTLASANLGNILFENLELGLNSADGNLRVHPIAADFFDGGYRGDVRIDASDDIPSIAANEVISDVSLGPMAKAVFDVDNITGTINGTFRLGGRGADMAAIRRDLDGSISMELIDGAWEGTDVWYELRRARAAIRGEPAPEPPSSPRTRFSSMKATGTVTDGVMQNDDFFAELPFMQVRGRGSVNFVEATVDYSVTGRFLEKPEFFTDVSEEELKDFTRAVIPLKISGPLADPKIRPDVEGMVRGRAEEEVKKRILDELLDDEEEAAEDAGAEEEKDVEDRLKDEARRALKDLLGGD